MGSAGELSRVVVCTDSEIADLHSLQPPIVWGAVVLHLLLIYNFTNYWS